MDPGRDRSWRLELRSIRFSGDLYPGLAAPRVDRAANGGADRATDRRGCAQLRANGRVSCREYNENGQVGDGTGTGLRLTPVDVLFPVDF